MRQANIDLHLSKTLILTLILFQPSPNPNPNPTQPYPLLLPAKEVTFSPLRHLLLFYDLAIFPAGATLNPFVSRTWRVSRRANLRCFYRTSLAQSLNKPLLILRRLSRLLRHFERKRLPDSNSGRTKRLMIVSGPSRDCLMTYESLRDI